MSDEIEKHTPLNPKAKAALIAAAEAYNKVALAATRHAASLLAYALDPSEDNNDNSISTDEWLGAAQREAQKADDHFAGVC
jgi:hypothetical protein